MRLENGQESDVATLRADDVERGSVLATRKSGTFGLQELAIENQVQRQPRLLGDVRHDDRVTSIGLKSLHASDEFIG